MNSEPIHYQSIEEALAEIPTLIPDTQCIIGIGGRAGSGKTFFTQSLMNTFNSVSCVGLDEFHFPQSSNQQKHYDYDRLINEVIVPFNSGEREITYQRYNFGHAKGLDYDGLDKWVKLPKSNILIIEGFATISNELSSFLDLSIWIQSDPIMSMNRALKRNIDEYGLKPMSKEEVATWKHGQEEWIKKNQPVKNATIIVDN